MSEFRFDAHPRNSMATCAGGEHPITEASEGRSLLKDTEGHALTSSNRAEIAHQLITRLPRLIFAGFDHFPLAGGEKAVMSASSTQLHILAVRAVPIRERLYENIREKLEKLASGQPIQESARILQLQIEGNITLVVCWHDVADFAFQLLKGSPSCVEALDSTEEPLYASKEWVALRESFPHSARQAIFQGKRYRCACAGPMLSLIGGKGAGSKAKLKSKKSAVELDKEPLSKCIQDVCISLGRRACAEDVEDALRTMVEDIALSSTASRSVFFDVAARLMQAASKVQDAAKELPIAAVDEWVDAIRHDDFQCFAAESQKGNLTPLITAGLPSEWAARLRNTWPEGADLVFMAQTGSFLYDLHTASSDSDYSIIFLSPVEDIAGRTPPPIEFNFHANGEFGSDKAGEIEYTGKELAGFIVELAKGNARNVELLFTDKPHETSTVWQELRDRRRDFLTLRCAAQYLGFIADRLHKAAPEIELLGAGEDGAGKRFSKCLYHAWHKIFELKRILHGDKPVVALKGDEHCFVMNLRLWPPRSCDEARTILDEAKANYSKLGDELDASRASGALPEEVDADKLAEWLRSIRERQAAATVLKEVQGKSPLKLARSVSTRSSGHDDVGAITHILEGLERTEGIRILHAGYAPSSRTLGTEHRDSDHDVHVIFVLHRSAYFGLNEPIQKFRRSFPATGDVSQVDVSGWEVRHACRMLAQSNPSVLHLLHSPIRFRVTRWTEQLQEVARQTLDKSALALAWVNHGRQNYQEFIKRRDEPIRKKYVHVLRPLLCMKWLHEKDWRAHVHCDDTSDFPPAPLLDLAREVASSGVLSESELHCVEALVAQRDELPLPLPRDSTLDALIESLLQSCLGDLAKRNASTSGNPPMDDAPTHKRRERWNSLCIEIIKEMSAFALESEP